MSGPNFPPIASDFETYFTREFVYGSPPAAVGTADIGRALGETGIMFNPSIWDTNKVILTISSTDYTEGEIAYLYLSAHLLVQNIQGAGGLQASVLGTGVLSQSEGVIESKSVGQVSIAQAFPEWVTNSPVLSQLQMTAFGRQYLKMLTPRLVGNMGLVSGRSPWNVGPSPQIPI